jgi:hypothetical protein
MSGPRKGERISRRDPPPYEEIEEGGLRAALSKHGLIGTALQDQNQYGPQAMILLLVITATITGTFLGIAMIVF